MGKLNYHPDFGGPHLMAAWINAAAQMLSDPRRRAEYDRLLFSKQSKKSASSASPLSRSGGVEDDHNADESSQPSANDRKREEMFREKECRSASRVNRGGAISYSFQQVGHRYHGELINLSPNGMRFFSEEKIEPFAKIEFQTPLLLGTATVKHCRETWRGSGRVYSIGVHFRSVVFERTCGTFLDLKA